MKFQIEISNRNLQRLKRILVDDGFDEDSPDEDVIKECFSLNNSWGDSVQVYVKVEKI